MPSPTKVLKDWEERLNRRDKYRQELLDFIKEEGTDTKAGVNGVEAETIVADEYGVFSETGDPDPDWEKGFLIRARQDALKAALNSHDILDAMERVETRQKEILKLGNWLVILAVIGLVMLGILLRR